jgi:cytochrome c oxidase subunit II
MTQIFLIAIVVMIFVVIFQIAKASEYVNVLKGEEKARKQNKRFFADFFFDCRPDRCMVVQ